jgi:hypothetical protein
VIILWCKNITKSFKIKRLIYVVHIKIVMDKTPIFVLYSIVAITIASTFSTLEGQTIEDKTMENINNVTKSMGESMADRSSSVVENVTTAMGESMAQNASSVVENISQSAVNRTGTDVSNQTESLVNQTASMAGNKTQQSSAANSTIT